MTAVPAATRSAATCVAGGAVGEGQEDRVGAAAKPARQSESSVRSVVVRCGWTVADRIVIAFPADEPDQLDIRVARQQSDQLATDVPGRPDDPDPDAPRAAWGSTPRADRGTNAVWLLAGASSVVVTVE